MTEYNFDKHDEIGYWTIDVDTSEQYGCFEHIVSGDGGGLWFVRDGEDGKLHLIDYDGVVELPKDVIIALRRFGFIVDSEFE